MAINLDIITEAAARVAIETNGGEVAVTSDRGGSDRGIAYIEEDGTVWVRWESGVSTPALFDR